MTPDLGALLITGTVGMGKTTTAHAVGDLLREQRTPNAVVDLDELHHTWPAPADDPFHTALELANLTSVAANFRAAGVRRLVLAGVVEGVGARTAYRIAVDMPLIICRLVVDLDAVAERLRGRHAPGAARDWHLARSGELDAILDRESAADVTVRVGVDTPVDVARRVLTAVGWSTTPTA